MKTDVNYASSTSDPKKESQSTIGTLGVKFENGYLFGSSVFIVGIRADLPLPTKVK